MAIPPRATPKANGNHHVNGAHGKDAEHARNVAALPIYHPRQTQAEPRRVYYSRAWFGLGATAAALGLLGLRRYGRPWLAGAGMLGTLSLAYMTLVEPARPVLERITLRLAGLPAQLDGLRIGQITDSHLGFPHTTRNLAWAVAQMQAERPELLVITGDLVSATRAIPELPTLLRALTAPLGVYAIPGNHDYWEGLPDIRAALTLLGIPMLMNEHRCLRWNGAELWLVGIDDVWDGQPDIAAALQGVPRDAFKVLLAHAPDVADEASGHGFALQLSGHTHGGHVRLPLLGPLTRPRYGIRYVMGRYDVGALALYVSRGLGGAPLRLLCRPEATILTLRRG
jgi:predicted MPP superfamily phosphohydrolase